MNANFAERIYLAWWPEEPPIAWADLTPEDRFRFHQAAQMLNAFVPGGELGPSVPPPPCAAALREEEAA